MGEEVGKELFGFGFLVAGAGCEYEIAGALVGHPLHDGPTQAAETPRDQIGCVGRNFNRAGFLGDNLWDSWQDEKEVLGCSGLSKTTNRNHIVVICLENHLADVSTRLHDTEGFFDLRETEDLEGFDR